MSDRYDDDKIIDITDYRSKKNEQVNEPIVDELMTRYHHRVKEKIERQRKDNFIFSMINLLLITQSLVVILMIYLLYQL